MSKTEWSCRYFVAAILLEKIENNVDVPNTTVLREGWPQFINPF